MLTCISFSYSLVNSYLSILLLVLFLFWHWAIFVFTRSAIVETKNEVHDRAEAPPTRVVRVVIATNLGT